MMSAAILPEMSMPFYWFMVVLWGLCLGSFTTCVMYRLPRGISLWKNTDGSHRSFCPVCHTALRGRDLVPVFSWLVQKGRCRHCGAPIPVFYPLIELAVLACVLGLGFLFHGTPFVFIIAFIVPFLFGLVAKILYRPSR